MNEIKLFLEANSAQALVKAMHENNVKHKKGFKYDTPHREGKKYIVWFTADILEFTKIENARKK